MDLEELPEFLTVEEAAAVLRIGRTSAYLLAQQWRDTGGRSGLPVQQLGRLLRVPRSAIERMAVTPGEDR
jgi:Helix-turn-helix domain